MAHARIGVYKLQPGAADEVVRRAGAGMLPIFQRQPGFRSYELVKTGDDAVISISTWESHAQAEAAIQSASSWVKEALGDLVVSVQNHVGEIGVDSRNQ